MYFQGRSMYIGSASQIYSTMQDETNTTL